MSDRKKQPKKLSYIVGIFKENIQNIDTFALNMYYAYYYNLFLEEAKKVQNNEITTVEDADYYEELFDMVSKIHVITKKEAIEGTEEEVYH